MRLYLVVPVSGLPYVRHGQSLERVTSRAFEKSPQGAEVRPVSFAKGGIDLVAAAGVMLPARIQAAYAKWLRAKVRKEAATTAAAERRRDKRTAEVEARRKAREEAKEAKAAAARAAKAAAKRATAAAAKRAAARALVVVDDDPSSPPWD